MEGGEGVFERIVGLAADLPDNAEITQRMGRAGLARDRLDPSNFAAVPTLAKGSLAAVQDVAQSHRSAQWMAHSHCSASHVARIRLALLRTLSAAIQQREEHAEQRETDHTRRTFAATAPLAAGINGLAPASNGAFGSPSASSSSAAANLRSPSLVASPDARGFHYALPLPLHSAFVSTPLVGAVRFA